MTDPVDHPRPPLRRSWTSLDGEWGFVAEIDDGIPGDAAFDRSIVVPFAPETPASGIGATDRLGPVWYRRRLDLGRPTDRRRTLLHLGAVDRVATVYADGRVVARHEGGYDEVTADVTGAEVVVVRADDDADDLSAPRGKQEWRDQPHSIWYPRTTGIWRTAWLEEVAATRLADLWWSGDPVAMRVTLVATVEGPLGPGTTLRFRLRHGARVVGVHDYTQGPEVLGARYADPIAVDAVVSGGLPSGRRVDLDGRGAEGRAVVLSEFGGVALSDDEDGTWGYQRATSPEDLLDRYRALWAAVHESSGLAGACWTQLTDTYQEANGLVRMDRTPKVPLEDLAAATRGRR